MYKVFIQNRPIFFISEDEISNFNGFFISGALASLHNDYIINLVKEVPEDLFIYIVCNDPLKEIDDFFHGFDRIEAAGGIVKRKKKYLFIKRNDMWDLPKGKIEPGEQPKIAAQREIEEECGIVGPKVKGLILITYHVYCFKDIPTVKKTYWYELSYDGPKEVTPQLEEGITEVIWKKSDDIDDIYTGTFESIKDVLSAYFVADSL